MKHILSVVLLTACSGLDSKEDTYSSVVDWWCLESPQEVIQVSQPRIQYITPVVDFDSQLTNPTVVPGATLTICTSAACDVPFTDWQRLEGPAEYVWVLSLPYGLSNATLRFEAPGYVPMDYPLGGPMIRDAKGVGVPLLKEVAYASLQAQVGIAAPDPTRGTFAARVLDCNNLRSSGVSLTGGAGVPFSLSNGNLASAGSQTDQRGVAGWFAVAPGTLDVQAFTGTGAAVDAPYTALVRAGAITLGELRPGLDQWGQ